jgi:methylenetetrahydrofolate dehydrogenase (NADP+)/methenyltetrahydrofolate cyclohydrolase
MILLDGRIAAATIKEDLQKKVKAYTDSGNRAPHLAAILVGNDPASETYVGAKDKACREIGYTSTIIKFSDSVSEKEILDKIVDINNNPEIDGLIVQLPLPKHINEFKVTQYVSPKKDVDGFHSVNIGRLAQGLPGFICATPYGIIKMLEHYQIKTEGKHCVVIGRSNIVGTPVSLLMSRNKYPGNASVTLCHSKSTNTIELAKQADILIAAVGKEGFINKDYVKHGSVVIDVGIHRVPSTETKSGFKLKGDVRFDEVAPLTSAITPVPGGVGAMTIAALMLNTWSAATKEYYQ